MTVIDVKTHHVIATLPVGETSFFQSIFTPDGKLAYVANRNENLVSVIDVKTHSVIAMVPVGIDPNVISITPN
ncbi:hypothetical protein ACSVDA_20850 [Cytobacillus sp. Hm23]